MRAWPAFVMLAFLLAGCADGAGSDGAAGCAALDDSATVEALGTNSVRVRMSDGEPADLNIGGSEIHIRDAAGCREGTASDIEVGDRVEFSIDVWATSYPMQGWPERLVVDRA